MASTRIYSAVKGHLQTTLAPMSILDWDQIEAALQQSQTPFVALEELFGDETITSFGDPTGICLREDSLIDAHVFVPSPESSSTARTVAEQVQQALRMRRLNEVRVLDVSPPDMGELNDGLWSVAIVSGNYQLDRIVPVP
jgi:hypothetical protein